MPKTQRSARVERIAARLFPGLPRFNSKGGLFSTLPWIYRRALHLFSPRAWQILTYVIMRCGPESITWVSDAQIAADLGIGPRKITPHMRRLFELGFLHEGSGVDGLRYLLVPDPYYAIQQLVDRGVIHGERLHALNDDAEQIGIQPFTRGGAVPTRADAAEDLTEAAVPF